MGGPGGTSEDEMTITVEEYSQDGCSVVSATSVAALFLSVFGITRRRRR